MKRIFVVFVLFSFVSIHLTAQNPCEGPASKKGKNNFEEALVFINKAMDPSCRTPDYLLNQAFPLIREVEKSDPGFAGTYFQLGILYTFRIEKRNLNSAKKYFEKCVEMCPDYNPDVYYHLSNIYYGEDNFEDAQINIEKYLAYGSELDNDEYLIMAKMLKSDAQKKIELFGASVPFDPVVVSGISSKYNEYLVNISPDNMIALYTRQQDIPKHATAYASEAGYAEKFFMSERGSDGNFDSGKQMPYPFNVRQNEGGATLTIDNREMFYTVCELVDCPEKGPEKYYNCDIYFTQYEFGGWNDIKPVSGNVNNNCSWESQPSIASDGKTLYFVSDRPGGFGGYDIYRSEKQEDNTWSAPVNLGKNINTPGDEKSPFIHTDSQTLYFSSDGRPGMGGMDIYFSKKQEDGTWLAPKNIGYPINTQYDELGFIVSTDGYYGYFASDRLGLGPGGIDFYSFELYEEARPEKILFVKGEVTDEQSDALIEARVEIKNMETKVVHYVPVNRETGKYVAVLPFKNDYVLTVKNENYVYESMYISLEDSVFEQPVTVDMELKPVEVGKSYKLNDIYYEYDSDRLTEHSLRVIEEFVEFLNENHGIKVAIHGHTDNIGGSEYNKELSERRAKSVYDYLISLGIQSSRMSYAGLGFDKPIASNETAEGRALNRRTEFVIISK